METIRNFIYAKYRHTIRDGRFKGVELIEELTGRGDTIFTIHKDLEGIGHHKEFKSLKEVFDYL